MSFSFSGAKVPGGESSMEQKFHGVKVPPTELSLPGAKVRGNESSIIRLDQTKRGTSWPGRNAGQPLAAGNLFVVGSNPAIRLVKLLAHYHIRILYDFKFYVPHSTSDDVSSMFLVFLARTIRYL